MLQSLYVKNLALIDEIEVEFTNGLHVLTGETGAGKSIILGSIQLALGGRYTADLIRHEAEYGFVELVFSISNPKQLDVLHRLDIDPEEGLIVLSRKLMEGRSVSKINGQTVTQSMLKKVANILIDIHGQHEHQTLLEKKNHLMILDEFMGQEENRSYLDYQTNYKAYCEKKRELAQADTNIESRNRELSFLQFELQEIEDANLIPGEDEELETQYRRLTHSKKIVENLDAVYQLTGTYGSHTASEAFSHSISYLQEIANYDEPCNSLLEQLAEIDSLLNDFNREVATYKEDMEFSGTPLFEVEQRLDQWNHLKGKYGKNFKQIYAYKLDIQEKITKLEDYDSYLRKLNEEIQSLEEIVLQLAQKLTLLRQKEAKVFSTEVVACLKELNFLDVQFEVAVQDSEQFQSTGKDRVEFMVSLNPGEPVKQLSNIASGGELSRIMLAIKTVMADKDQVDTLIFDEVDAGISGRTAMKVGEKLAVIGQSRQVICISHLAQIAALANEHFIIEKKSEKNHTKTNIYRLNYEQSIEELIRILGGGQISDAIIESAKQMKELASAIK